MRFTFSDLSRPKVAAKKLAQLSPRLKLSSAQQALARVLGYRDWDDLSATSGRGLALDRGCPLSEVKRIIATLADELSLPDGEVQYVVSRTRLLRGEGLRLDEQQTLRASLWRERLFGAPARGKPGTVVNVKSAGSIKRAYLLRPGRPTYVFYENVLGACGDFEAVTPRLPLPDFVPAQLWLPYGYWTLKDGSEVVFSRDYLPMWRVWNGLVERLDPWLWIRGITGELHFSTVARTSGIWSRGKSRSLAEEHLAHRRIRELPKLVEAMPHLLESSVTNVRDSVRLLYQSTPQRTAAPFARINSLICTDADPTLDTDFTARIP